MIRTTPTDFFFFKSLNCTEGKKHVVIPKELLVTLSNTKQRNNYTLNLSIIQVILSIFFGSGWLILSIIYPYHRLWSDLSCVSTVGRKHVHRSSQNSFEIVCNFVVILQYRKFFFPILYRNSAVTQVHDDCCNIQVSFYFTSINVTRMVFACFYRKK